MSTEVPPSRALPATRKVVVISPENATELAMLYKRLPYATVAARAAQKLAREMPTEGASRKFMELDQLVGELIGRINKLLG